MSVPSSPLPILGHGSDYDGRQVFGPVGRGCVSLATARAEEVYVDQLKGQVAQKLGRWSGLAVWAACGGLGGDTGS